MELVDRSTGELIDMDKFYLRSRKSDEAFRRIKETQTDNRHFSFANMDNIPEIIQLLSNVHCGYLLILQSYVEFCTGKIKISRKQMPKALGKSEATFKRFWSVVCDNGIISNNNGEYYMNERYHFRQRTKSQRVIKIFFTPLKQLREVLQPAELGFIYKLLPFVDYSTNMICCDPTAYSEDIRFLNKTQIASLVGMEQKKAFKILDKLRDARVIVETPNRNNKRDRSYTLNPYVFYRKSGKPDESLHRLFAS
jgi:hypothetical protein